MSVNPGDGAPKFGKMVPGGGAAPANPGPPHGAPPPPASSTPPPPPHAAPPSPPYAAPPAPEPAIPYGALPPAGAPPPPTAGLATPAFAPPTAVDPMAGGVAASDPILFTLGDIAVSRSWVVTPNGTAPIHGSTWIGQDMSRTETKTPTWAIVLAIVGFLACLLGLLFLLAKEEKTTGYFEVTVQSGAVRHVTQLPVSSPAQVAQYRQMVHQAQSLAAAAG